MDAREIAEQLQKLRDSSEKIHDLIGAIGRRRNEIESRHREISPHPFGNPALAEATVAGPDAVADLQAEAESLQFEHSYLDELERQAERLKQAARRSEIRADLPLALKEFPAGMAGVRSTMAAFDAAIEKLNSNVLRLALYEEGGLPHPLPDHELAKLLELRNAVWAVRNVQVLYPARPGSQLDPHEPDDPGQYPESFRLMFEKVGNRVRRIAPPRQRKPE